MTIKEAEQLLTEIKEKLFYSRLGMGGTEVTIGLSAYKPWDSMPEPDALFHKLEKLMDMDKVVIEEKEK